MVHLETEVGREQLSVACRHHVAEIILEKMLSLNFVSSIQLWRYLAIFWPIADQTASQP